MIDINKYGLKLIKVDLPFRLNHVNCFLIEGENGWTLIDTGLNNNETRMMWDSIFKEKKLTNIIVTHEHPDHIGSCGYLQNKYETDVWMTENAYRSANYFIEEERISHLKVNYKKCGVPASFIEQLLKANDVMKHAVNPLPNVTNYLNENEFILLGDYRYEVIYTQGHADGLIVLFNKEKSVLISTDHILPQITPNISYWFIGDPNPLHSYLTSLHKIKKLEAKVVIPSHGQPFYDANKRIDEIIAHHDERLNTILTIVKYGGTVFDITNKMFDKQLTSHEMRFAIGEAIAHLEYLRHLGECVREEKDGLWIYRTI